MCVDREDGFIVVGGMTVGMTVVAELVDKEEETDDEQNADCTTKLSVSSSSPLPSSSMTAAKSTLPTARCGGVQTKMSSSMLSNS